MIYKLKYLENTFLLFTHSHSHSYFKLFLTVTYLLDAEDDDDEDAEAFYRHVSFFIFLSFPSLLMSSRFTIPTPYLPPTILLLYPPHTLPHLLPSLILSFPPLLFLQI